MKHVSVIAIIVLLTVLPSCKFFKERGLFGKKVDPMIALQAEQDSIRVSDSIRKAQERLLAIELAKIDSARVAEEERMAWEKKNKYNIIVGSFITPQYAKDLSEEYNKIGYNTNIIRMEGDRFDLVSAEAHDNFRKAYERLLAFQDTVAIDAWMYILK